MLRARQCEGLAIERSPRFIEVLYKRRDAVRFRHVTIGQAEIHIHILITRRVFLLDIEDMVDVLVVRRSVVPSLLQPLGQPPEDERGASKSNLIVQNHKETVGVWDTEQFLRVANLPLRFIKAFNNRSGNEVYRLLEFLLAFREVEKQLQYDVLASPEVRRVDTILLHVSDKLTFGLCHERLDLTHYRPALEEKIGNLDASWHVRWLQDFVDFLCRGILPAKVEESILEVSSHIRIIEYVRSSNKANKGPCSVGYGPVCIDHLSAPRVDFAAMGKGSKKRPPPEKPDWKKLEEVVFNVERFIVRGARDATVKLNDRVIGRSGRRRQLDVTLRYKIGNIPNFVVFECRHYKRPVDIDQVEAFAKKLEDVRALRGVMISSKGFDAGAEAIAARNNILLKKYREADETDWNKLMGESWGTLITMEYEINRVAVVLSDKQRIEDVPHNMVLFNGEGGYYEVKDGAEWTVRSLFLDGWNVAPRPRPIGQIELTVGLARDPIFISYFNKILPTHSFVIEAVVTPKRYALDTRFIQGEVLEESTESRKLDYIKANLNVRALKEGREGLAFSSQEWEQHEKAKKMEFEMDSTASYFM